MTAMDAHMDRMETKLDGLFSQLMGCLIAYA